MLPGIFSARARRGPTLRSPVSLQRPLPEAQQRALQRAQIEAPRISPVKAPKWLILLHFFHRQ